MAGALRSHAHTKSRGGMMLHTEAITIRRWTGGLPDAFNQQPITSIVGTRNGVVSNAAKPRTRLSGSNGFQRASTQAQSSCGSMTTIGVCLGHYLSLHFRRNMMCDALASLSEHYLQAFRVDIISSVRLRPSLGGSP